MKKALLKSNSSTNVGCGNPSMNVAPTVAKSPNAVNQNQFLPKRDPESPQMSGPVSQINIFKNLHLSSGLNGSGTTPSSLAHAKGVNTSKLNLNDSG